MAAGGSGVSRRQFLRWFGGTSLALAVAPMAPAVALARGATLVYYLDPLCQPNSHGCRTCHACWKHARHKLWKDEASIVRAHLHCRCAVRSRPIAAHLYRQLFGGEGFGPERAEFDRRRHQLYLPPAVGGGAVADRVAEAGNGPSGNGPSGNGPSSNGGGAARSAEDAATERRRGGQGPP